MGCAQSKIEDEEAVQRCKERRHLMKQAVASRNAFAATHSGYAVSLKNTGAALSDFAEGEVPHILPASNSSNPSAAAAAASTSTPIVKAPVDAPLPPPPPPLSDFQTPLQRAASMPDIPIPKAKKLPAEIPIVEDDDDDEVDSSAASSSSPPPPKPPPIQPRSDPIPPPPPAAESQWDYFFNTDDIPPPMSSLAPPPKPVEEAAAPAEKVVVEPPPRMMPPPVQPKVVKKQKQPVHHQHAASVGSSGGGGGGGESKRGRIVASGAPKVDLLKILKLLDDHFLKASQSAHDVAKMLEATRMHYHSNFADNRGHIDHSARVMQVITWNRSFRGMQNSENSKDIFDDDESETHATVLDKMLAWEKKLYDEVKASELMKIEYQRKVASLNKQKKRGASSETLEKTKAAVSHLHTRYIVDMQSMDSTVSEINRLRDRQLYPKLVELVDGMEKMWGAMSEQHSTQLEIAKGLKALEISLAPNETSEEHHERTCQLWEVVKEWHSHFQELMKHQKAYIQALHSWLKLNLVSTESSMREKVSSPPKEPHPSIQILLRAWHEHLEKLPDALAGGAIYSFSEVIKTIMIIQEDELKLKFKCEETRRELMKRNRAFEDWHRKYLEKVAAAAASSSEAEAAAAGLENSDAANQNDPVAERKVLVESLRARLGDEEDSYRRTCRQVREKSIVSLRLHLPELFRAMSEFARSCSDMYKQLNSTTTQPHNTAEPS